MKKKRVLIKSLYILIVTALAAVGISVAAIFLDPADWDQGGQGDGPNNGDIITEGMMQDVYNALDILAKTITIKQNGNDYELAALHQTQETSADNTFTTKSYVDNHVVETWNPIPSTFLGDLPTNGATKSYTLPSSVPASAHSVLLYVWAMTGGDGSDHGITHFEIFTQEGSTKYSNYLFTYQYGVNAWTFNSDNMWMPVTSQRQVYATPNKPLNVNFNGKIALIGYR